MKPMRKTLLGLMALLIFTPSLVCAMTVCPMQSVQAGEKMPCHEKSVDNQDGGVMLVSDCMGVDFFVEDTSHDLEIDPQVDALDFVWADLTSGYNSDLRNINGVRGPPPRGIVANVSQPLYLTTQRFRI